MRAVVFDFDGVIIDTEWVAYTTWQTVFAEHRAELTIEEFATCLGTRGAIDFSALLTAKTGRPAPSNGELRLWKQALQDVAVADLPLLPGIQDWLDTAAAAGLVRAIASSSERTWIQPHIERHAIAHHFAHVATWDGPHVGFPPKPAPDLYLHCVAALGVEPHEALAVEDSVNGCVAAKTAGLRCVVVPTQLTAHLDFSMADLVVESLDRVTLTDAIASLEGVA